LAKSPLSPWSFGSAISCASPPPQTSIFSDYSLCVHPSPPVIGMTCISLHMELPLTSQSHGRFFEESNYCFVTDKTPRKENMDTLTLWFKITILTLIIFFYKKFRPRCSSATRRSKPQPSMWQPIRLSDKQTHFSKSRNKWRFLLNLVTLITFIMIFLIIFN
jgi:hypothetical protein